MLNQKNNEMDEILVTTNSSSNDTDTKEKVYLKIHHTTGGTLYAFASPENIGKTYYNKKVKVKVTESFYRGELISLERGLELVKKHYNSNIIGKLAELAVKKGIIHPKAVLWLDSNEKKRKVAHSILMSI